MKVFSAFLFATLIALPAMASESGHDHKSAYVGEEQREIKALSADDIAELERGGGWGLARPAELNGVPGPAHLLEMADEIELDESQRAAIQSLFDRMNTKAKVLGAELIESERALDQLFREGVPTAEALADAVERAESARRELRLVHLATHLETPRHLTPDQIARYNVLRGYAADPCASAPEGHDPAMWRKHNGCD